MCGLTRFYCVRDGYHWIEDVPREHAAATHKRLMQEGTTIYHSVVL